MSESVSKTKRVLLNSREIEIPSDWDLVTIGNISQKIKGKKPDSLYDQPAPGRLPYLTISASKGEVSQWADSDDGKRVSDNQILMVWDGASSGTVFKSSEGMIGSTLAAFKFEDSTFDNEFAYYFLSHFENRISELAEGTGIPHVPRDFTQVFQVLTPPLLEQRRIANILSTVDKQIQQTDEIIDSIIQIRKGVLDDVIRKGRNGKNCTPINLGPKSLVKPEKWEIQSIGDVADVTVGHVSGISEDYSETGSVPVLSTKNISESGIDLSEVNYVREDFDKKNAGSRANPGDIIMARHGDGGTCAQIPDTVGPTQCLNVVIIKPQTINADFLQYQMNLAETRKRLMAMAGGSVQSVVNTGTIRSFKILVPTDEDQSSIIDVGNTIDRLLNIEKDRKRDLVHLKRGLMQDLLTGKVRVNTD